MRSNGKRGWTKVCYQETTAITNDDRLVSSVGIMKQEIVKI